MSSGLFQKTQSLCFSSQSNKTISVYMNGNDAHLVLFSLQNTFKEIVIFFLTNSGSSERDREVNGTPLWYSCLENPMDGGAWWAVVHGVAKSRTGLSNFTFTFHFHALEKEMATHPSVLAWRIPGTTEPGGLPSMGSHRVGHDWSDLAAAVKRDEAYSFFFYTKSQKI